MGRPRTPLLSRDRIRDTALTLIDRDGLAGLSMRKLAAELGVQAASLYKHYPTKDQVLDAIVHRVISGVDTSAFERGDDWPSALAAWARSYRTALAGKYVEGKSLETLADELGVSVDAAKSLLARARRAFKETFSTLGHALSAVAPDYVWLLPLRADL